MDMSNLLMPEDFLQVYDATGGSDDLLVEDVQVAEELAEDVTDLHMAQLFAIVQLDHAYCKPSVVESESAPVVTPLVVEEAVAPLVVEEAPPMVRTSGPATRSSVAAAATASVTSPTGRGKSGVVKIESPTAVTSPQPTRVKTSVVKVDSPVTSPSSRAKPSTALVESPASVVTPKSVSRLTTATASDSGGESAASPVRRSRRQMEKLEREQQSKVESEGESSATVPKASAAAVCNDSDTRTREISGGQFSQLDLLPCVVRIKTETPPSVEVVSKAGPERLVPTLEIERLSITTSSQLLPETKKVLPLPVTDAGEGSANVKSMPAPIGNVEELAESRVQIEQFAKGEMAELQTAPVVVERMPVLTVKSDNAPTPLGVKESTQTPPVEREKLLAHQMETEKMAESSIKIEPIPAPHVEIEKMPAIPVESEQLQDGPPMVKLGKMPLASAEEVDKSSVHAADMDKISDVNVAIHQIAASSGEAGNLAEPQLEGTHTPLTEMDAISSAASIYAAVDERLKIRAPPELPFEIMACDVPGESDGGRGLLEEEEPRVCVRPLDELPAHFIPSAVMADHASSGVLNEPLPDPRSVTSSLIGPDDAALLLAAVAAATAPLAVSRQTDGIPSPSKLGQLRRSRELSLDEIDDGFGKVVQRRPSGGSKKVEAKVSLEESPTSPSRKQSAARKSYPKRENRKPPAHLMDMFEPPLFSKPDRMKKMDMKSDELSDDPTECGEASEPVRKTSIEERDSLLESGGAPKKSHEDIEDYLSRVDGDNEEVVLPQSKLAAASARGTAVGDFELKRTLESSPTTTTTPSAKKDASVGKKQNRKPMPSRKGEFRRNRKDKKRRSALNQEKKGSKEVKGPTDVGESESSSGTGSTSETDSDWCSEDDPDRLWCICNQPHNDRFMISCDKCEDWYHGTCVGVSRKQGREWEKNGQEWTCPKCVKAFKTPVKEKRPDPKVPTKTPGVMEKMPAVEPTKPTAVTVVAQVRPQPPSKVAVAAVRDKPLPPTKSAAEMLSRDPRERPKLMVASPTKDRTAIPKTTAEAAPGMSKERSLLRPSPETTKMVAPSKTAEIQRVLKSVAMERAMPRMAESVLSKEAPPAAPKAVQRTTDASPDGTKAQLCVVGCGRTARPDSIFCGNECILQKADMSIKVVGKDKEKERKLMMKSLIKPEMKKEVVGEQIMALDKSTGKAMAVPTALTAIQLREWLKQHPTAQIVKTGSKETAVVSVSQRNFYGTPQKTIKLIGAQQMLPIENPLDKSKPAAKSAPLVIERKEVVGVKKVVPEVRRVSTDNKAKTAPLVSPKTIDPRKPRLSLPSQGVATAPVAPPTPTPSGPEPIRENVQKTLRDILATRNNEIDVEPLLTDEIKKVADSIEEELFKFFNDVGTKYKAKYRSLMFNIKDPRNHGLFQKILRGKISPYKLVRMTPEELASKELAMWREREAKHTLEMIKREQEDQKHVPIIKKTHKGEIEIDEVDVGFSEKPSKPKVEFVPPEVVSTPLVDTTEAHRSHLFDLNCKICTGQMLAPADVADPSAKKARVATSISMESRSQDEESEDDVAARASKEKETAATAASSSSKMPTSSKKRDEPVPKKSSSSSKFGSSDSKDKNRKEKTRHDERSGSSRDKDKGRSKVAEAKSKSGSNKPESERDRSKMSSSSSGGGSRNKDREKDRPQEGTGKTSQERDKDKSKSSSRTTTKEKDKNRSSSVDSNKAKDKSSKDRDRAKEGNKEKPKEKSSTATFGDARKEGDGKVDKGEPSKTVKRSSTEEHDDMPKKSKKAKMDDDAASINVVAKTADDREPTSTVTISSPDSAVTSQSDVDGLKSAQASVWKGFITMQDVAKFVTSAYKVSGPTDFLAQDIPDTIQVCGRIAPDTVWDYLSKVKQSGNKEFLVIRFNPANDEENVAFELFYTYLNSRNRFGVVGNCSKVIKDFYILPLGSNVPIPETLLPFEYFDESRTDTLLGVIIRHKGKRKASNGKSGKSGKKTRNVSVKSEASEAEETSNGAKESSATAGISAAATAAAKRVKFDLQVKTSVLGAEDGDQHREPSYTPPLEDLPTQQASEDPTSSPYDPSYTPPLRDSGKGDDSPYSPGQSHPAAEHDDSEQPYDPEEEPVGGNNAKGGGAEKVSKTIIPGLLAGSVSSQSVSELIDQISMSSNPTEITTTVLASIATATNLEQQRKLLIELTQKVEEQKRQLEMQKQQIATKVTAQVMGAMATVTAPFAAVFAAKALSGQRVSVPSPVPAIQSVPAPSPLISTMSPPKSGEASNSSTGDAPYEPKDDDEEAYSPSYTPPPMETNDDDEISDVSNKSKAASDGLAYTSAALPPPTSLNLTDTSSISLPPNLVAILESIKKQAATPSSTESVVALAEPTVKSVTTILEDPIVKNFLSVDETDREESHTPPLVSSSGDSVGGQLSAPPKQSDPRLKMKSGVRLDPRRKPLASSIATAAEDKKKSELGSLSASELLEKAMKQFEDLSGSDAGGDTPIAAVSKAIEVIRPTTPPVSLTPPYPIDSAVELAPPTSTLPLLLDKLVVPPLTTSGENLEPPPPGMETLALSAIPIPPTAVSCSPGMSHPMTPMHVPPSPVTAMSPFGMPPPSIYAHLNAQMPSSPVSLPSNFSIPPPNYQLAPPPTSFMPQQQPPMYTSSYQTQPPLYPQQTGLSSGGGGAGYWQSGLTQEWRAGAGTGPTHYRGRGNGGLGSDRSRWDGVGASDELDFSNYSNWEPARRGSGGDRRDSSWDSRRNDRHGDRHRKGNRQQDRHFRNQDRRRSRDRDRSRSRDRDGERSSGNRSRDRNKIRSKSPDRDRSRSRSRSPRRSRSSRSPDRERTRSPARERTRSPVRERTRSPVREKTRSPVRGKTRSPVRERSRSPAQVRARSPFRERTRSPVGERTRSPVRERTRSPVRERTRSPVRERTRSPVREKTRSPVRGRTRSPVREKSRSPVQVRARSPFRESTRSPVGERTRSPVRGSNMSLDHERTTSPVRERTRSPNSERGRSPVRSRSRSTTPDRLRSKEADRAIWESVDARRERSGSKDSDKSRRGSLDKPKSMEHTESPSGEPVVDQSKTSVDMVVPSKDLVSDHDNSV